MFQHGPHGRLYLRRHLGRELVHLPRFAAHDVDLRRERSERLGNGQRTGRYREVQIHLAGRFHGLHPDDVDRARGATPVHGVDDDEPVARGQQLLGQADPGGTHLHDLDIRDRLPLLQSSNDLDAKPVVAAQDVAEAGDQRPHGQRPTAGSTPTTTRISSSSTATGKTARCSTPPSSRLPVRTS